MLGMAYWTCEPCDVLRFVQRLCAEFDCTARVQQVNNYHGRRACHVIDRPDLAGPRQPRVLIWELIGPLPASEAESLLLQLGIPLRAFGIEPGFPPVPPTGMFH